MKSTWVTDFESSSKNKHWQRGLPVYKLKQTDMAAPVVDLGTQQEWPELRSAGWYLYYARYPRILTAVNGGLG